MSDIREVVQNHDILMRLSREGIESREELIEADRSGKLSTILGEPNAREISRRIHSNDSRSLDPDEDWP